MNRNTQEEILDTAKKLFNEYGYDSVSIRQIAEQLGISKGNLTYHFKKKEDIVEAILEKGSSAHDFVVPKNLKELDRFFKYMQETVQDNAFYFTYYTQLANLSSHIQQMQISAIKVVSDDLKKAFIVLSEQGLMEEEHYDGEYDYIIETLLLTNIYWIPFHKLKGDVKEKKFSSHAWKLVHGLLSERGKRELSELKAYGEQR